MVDPEIDPGFKVGDVLIMVEKPMSGAVRNGDVIIVKEIETDISHYIPRYFVYYDRGGCFATRFERFSVERMKEYVP